MNQTTKEILLVALIGFGAYYVLHKTSATAAATTTTAATNAATVASNNATNSSLIGLGTTGIADLFGWLNGTPSANGNTGSTNSSSGTPSVPVYNSTFDGTLDPNLYS